MEIAKFGLDELHINRQARSKIRAVFNPSLETRCNLEGDVHARIFELEPLHKVAQYDLVLEDR